jgi:hypothetical protein
VLDGNEKEQENKEEDNSKIVDYEEDNNEKDKNEKVDYNALFVKMLNQNIELQELLIKQQEETNKRFENLILHIK